MRVETAPMAGFTNAEFRAVLADCGAPVIWTEMVSAAAIFYGNKKTLKLLEIKPANEDPGTRPNSPKHIVQLFGHKPEHFVFAIQSGLLSAFSEIDINMGCPAGKIVKNNEGAALMKNFDLAREIIRACVAAASVPVSVKIRLGINDRDVAEKKYIEFAKMCEDAGAARIIVHGRTAEAGYSGVANWAAIAEIVRAVKIPVIANGDIKSAADARAALAATGASGVMVGRMLLPLYRRYFPHNLRILRGEKICRDGGFDICFDKYRDFFSQCADDGH